MKTWTDLDWKRLAIVYLVQDEMADKETLLWMGMAISGWIVSIINIIIIIKTLI